MEVLSLYFWKTSKEDDDSVEHTWVCYQTMILDMAVSTHDFGQFFLQWRKLKSCNFGNEYWTYQFPILKYNEFFVRLLVSENNISSLIVLLQNSQSIALWSTAILKWRKSNGSELKIWWWKNNSWKGSIFEGTSINFISQLQTWNTYWRHQKSKSLVVLVN